MIKFNNFFEPKATSIAELTPAELENYSEEERQIEEFYLKRSEMVARWRQDVAPFLKAVPTGKEVPKKLRRDKNGGELEPTEMVPEYSRLKLTNILDVPEGEWIKFIDREACRQYVLSLAQDGKTDLDEAVDDKIEIILDSLREVRDLRQQITPGEEEQPTFSPSVYEAYGFRLSELSIARYQLTKKNEAIERAERKCLLGHYKKNYLDLLSQAREDMSRYLETDPNAFIGAAYEKIRNMKEVFDRNGRIVETAYVEQMMETTEEFLNNGRAVFVHGELGSGKTELMRHLCVTRLSLPHLERWEKGDPELGLPAHPRPLSKDFADMTKYKTALRDWESLRVTEAAPYIISGHPGLEPDAPLGGQEIVRKMTLAPEEQAKVIGDSLERWKVEHADDPNLLEQLEILKNAYRDTMNSPVETRVYLGALYKAMKEGRPIIIDEMNAIKHHVLIVLNELLNKKPGELVQPMLANEPPFRVKEGFSLLATGNWAPGGSKLYVGRQDMDAAFLSRFDFVNYDYLPNASEFDSYSDPDPKATPEEIKQIRDSRQDNELFHMLLVRMLDQDGSIELPNGKAGEPTGMQQIFELARAARVIQDIFSNKLTLDEKSAYSANFSGANADPSELIKENVLSIRHLIPILEEWKEHGFTRPLDDYIFLHYIARSSKRPEEMKYLYQLLQSQFGFFNPGSGNPPWPDAAQDLDEILRYDIHRKLYGRDPLVRGRRMESLVASGMSEVERLSPLQVIEKMFGPIPRRTVMRKHRDGVGRGEEVSIEDQLNAKKLAEDKMAIRDLFNQLARYEDTRPETAGTDPVGAEEVDKIAKILGVKETL